jgi:hypothetical protein
MAMRPRSTAVLGVVARPITDVDAAVSDESRIAATMPLDTPNTSTKAISGLSGAKHPPHHHLYLVAADSTPQSRRPPASRPIPDTAQPEWNTFR